MSYFRFEPPFKGPLWRRPAVALWFLLGVLFRQRQLIFRPNRQRHGSPIDLGLTFEEVSLPLGQGQELIGWWIPSRPSSRTVLFFPGSIGNLTHELPTFDFLRSLGVNTLAFDYPGYGRSTGQPSPAICHRAAAMSWAHLQRERGIAAEDIILFGRSLGSALATRLAATQPCGGLVFHGGFDSLTSVASRSFPAWLVKVFFFARMSNERWITSCRCPALFIHATHDEVTPITSVRTVYTRCGGPKCFVEIDGSHFDPSWPRHSELRARWRELLEGEAERWPSDRPFAEAGP